MLKLLCFVLALIAFEKAHSWQNGKRSFTVDMKNKTFLKDGKPYRYISGEFHYFRAPHQYWEDRIEKMAAAGLDAVQTYVAWNLHEPEEGVFDFEGQKDLFKFFEIIQKNNMYVILRPGPYICGEWDYGGFPAWFLSKDEPFNIRRYDEKYLQMVRNWFSRLLPLVRPYLYVNGGPILMVQVENEYGSYMSICDHQYMDYMADMIKEYLGSDVLLFTTDGASTNALTCGSTSKAFATIDFGPGSNVTKSFGIMRNFNKGLGPVVNSELYTGWIDAWGDKEHHIKSTDKIINAFGRMDEFNASYNMYMFFGGTSFGFMNGAIEQEDKNKMPINFYQTNSYDYDSPMSEAGDVTEKYLKIREYISKRKPNLPPVPKNMEKKAYGDIKVEKVGALLDLLDIASTRSVETHHPIPMEKINHYYGFTLYRHIFKNDYENQLLNVTGLRDKGQVLLDGKLLGTIQKYNETSVILSATKGQQLDIIVENFGRYNYGRGLIKNSKGIIEKVRIGSGNDSLTGWTIHPINLDNFFNKRALMKHRISSHKLRWQRTSQPQVPSIYMGSFQIPKGETPKDTFLDTCGWTWGVIYVNGVNLGRFRPKLGPQTTLYLPGVYLKPYPEKNTVMVFETENVELLGLRTAKIVSRNIPQINSTCSNYL